MKKLVLFTLLTMLISLSAFSHDIQVANSDGVTIYYNWTNNKTELSVTYLGSDLDWRFNSERYTGKVVIPESVIYDGKTYSVTEIGFNAFTDCTGLTSIEIPNSVTSIGMEAFSGCTGLTSIEIPKSVRGIGKDAFKYSNLYKVILCNSLVSVDFYYDYSLVDLFGTKVNEYIIRDEVTRIGDYVFAGCTGLTSIEIPNSVTTIGECAFAGCSGLTSINIPNSVTSIGWDAFGGCTGLTSIEIPNSVTSIGNYAFSGCTGLTSIEIPNSVTSIGDRTFYNCTGLTSVYLDCSSISTFFDGCIWFDGCTSIKEVTIGKHVMHIGFSVFSGCTGLTSIKVEEGNPNYDSRNNCNAIIETSTNTLIAGCNSTVIPNNVTSIGVFAFEGTGLTSIEIPNSVTSISYGAFYRCVGLTSIKIPNSVTSIDGEAFKGCTGLTDIYCYATIVPATVTYVSIFEDTEINNITLHVPAASIDAYRKTAPWNGFKTIVGISETEPSTFQLIYMIDGVEYKTYIVEEGASITPESAPTKEGYTFSGWDYVPTTMPAEDVVVNGTFTINSTEQETEDNAIYAEDVTGFVGSKIVLPIVMNNTEDIIGLQFDVTLPEGVNVEIDEDDEYMFTLTNRATSSHNVIANKLGDGRYRVLVSSMQNRQFKGSEGTVMEAMLAIPKHMAAGEYPVTISKIEMSTAQNIAIRPNAFVSKLTVRDIMPGDANGDGTVSVTDVTMTISHILGLTPEGFIAEAADVNGDGSISVTDVTILIDMILKQK
jgi:hypothetical protein